MFGKTETMCLTVCVGVAVLCLAAAGALTAAPEDVVAVVFQKNCTTAGCHSGAYPAMGLDLSEANYRASLFDVSSREMPDRKLVDPQAPSESYLLMKLRGAAGITGQRMPLGRDPLTADEIDAIAAWIGQITGTGVPENEMTGQSEAGDRPAKPGFWAPRAINLPTPRAIGPRRFLFRIAHRFYPSVREGYDVFYGLDGPASILLSLGYGFSDRFDLTLSRSNRFQEWSLTFDYVWLRPQKDASLPLTAAAHLVTGLVTEKREGIPTFAPENMKFTFQLSLALEVHERVALLLVPSYAANTNHWESESEGTLALGTGVRVTLFDEFSILVEWIPVLAGYHAKSQGWGLALEKKIGGHVFQVFALSTVGIPETQYLPGGDLCIREGDVRFGFNIFRWF
jgi:hypothetical protein